MHVFSVTCIMSQRSSLFTPFGNIFCESIRALLVGFSFTFKYGNLFSFDKSGLHTNTGIRFTADSVYSRNFLRPAVIPAPVEEEVSINEDQQLSALRNVTVL